MGVHGSTCGTLQSVCSAPVNLGFGAIIAVISCVEIETCRRLQVQLVAQSLGQMVICFTFLPLSKLFNVSPPLVMAELLRL